MPLVTYEDLTGPARSNAGRHRHPALHLPHERRDESDAAGTAAAGERRRRRRPLDLGPGGLPRGSCGGDGDPFAAAPTCTERDLQRERGGHRRADAPGAACLACHTSEGEGPRRGVAGTVYPSGHEPDDCSGSPAAGARVVVTDSTGRVVTLSLNGSGNFLTETALAPRSPRRLPTRAANASWPARSRAATATRPAPRRAAAARRAASCCHEAPRRPAVRPGRRRRAGRAGAQRRLPLDHAP